jgi:mRNA interferase MazF
VTSQVKHYPFEVPLPEGLPVHGVVLSDHLRSDDWEVRRAEFVSQAPSEVVEEVRTKVLTLLGT